MSVYQVLSILFIHWLADFVFQNDEEAQNKSSSFFYLTRHTAKYTLVWVMFYPLLLIMSDFYGEKHTNLISNIFVFLIVTFVCHTITDFITSRITKRLYKEGDIHNFFVVIGIDQWFHYVQLFITFWLLNYK